MIYGVLELFSIVLHLKIPETNDNFFISCIAGQYTIQSCRVAYFHTTQSTFKCAKRETTYFIISVG